MARGGKTTFAWVLRSEILIQHVGVKEAEEDIDVDDFIGGALRLGGS